MAQKTYTLNSCIELFLLDREAINLADTSIVYYQQRLTKFELFCNDLGVTLLHEITSHTVRSYLIHLRQYSESYAHGCMRAVRAFINFVIAEELITNSPMKNIRMPKVAKKVPQVFTDNEINRIIFHSKTLRDRAICLFLLESGVRAREMLSLNVEDIDGRTVHINKGKGNKYRVCYIGSKAKRTLLRYLFDRDNPHGQRPLFTTRSDTRLQYDGLRMVLDGIRRSTGIKKCKAHTFRRTFAVNCLRNGMDIYILANLMGHTDITVLRHYLAFVQKDLQDAYDKAHLK